MRDFLILLPEALIAVTLLAVIIGEATHHGERVRLISATAFVGLFGALVQTVVSYRYGNATGLGASVVVDGLTLFFKLFFILLAALSIGIALLSREIAQALRSEYVALILAGTIAMCLASAAHDLVLAFLSLFGVQLIGHFLSGYSKRSLASTEAAMKHLVFGALSSGAFLFASAILYLKTQSLNLIEIQRYLVTQPLDPQVGLVVFMLFFISITTYLAAFPAHLWAADVAAGAPTPAGAFIITGGRAVGFAFAIRLVAVVFVRQGAGGEAEPPADVRWPEAVAFVAAMSMIIGALMSYVQVQAKRMVAHWVVSQTGFFLMGVLVLDRAGLSALLFALLVDLFSLAGAFYMLTFLVNRTRSDRLEDLNGSFARYPLECVCLVIFLASVIGLPPTPGFIARFSLLNTAAQHGWHFLVLIAIASTAVSTAAFARLSYSLMGQWRPATDAPVLEAAERTGARMMMGFFVVPLLFVLIYAQRLLLWTGESVRAIFW